MENKDDSQKLGLDIKCGICGKFPSFNCREHFVARIKELENEVKSERTSLLTALENAVRLTLGRSASYRDAYHAVLNIINAYKEQ